MYSIKYKGIGIYQYYESTTHLELVQHQKTITELYTVWRFRISYTVMMKYQNQELQTI